MENANILNIESKVQKRLDINNDLKENFCMPNVSTIDKVIVRVQTAVAPNTGLTAVLNVVAGGTTTALQSFVAGGLSTVGSTQSLITAPVYIGSQPGRLALTLAGAAATAGIVTFIVTYTSTVQLPK